MKSIPILIVLTFVTLLGFSQTNHKLILNFNAHRNDFARPVDHQFRHSFWFPSLEYLNRKGKRILSFELAKFTKRTLGSLPTTNIPFYFAYKDVNRQVALRAQYQRLTKVLISDATVSVNPYYGIALTPHYSRIDRNPLISTFTNRDYTSMGLTSHASLGMYIQFRKFFINANTLWGLGQIEKVQKNISDPSMPVEQQHNKYTQVKFLPKDNLFRIGFGIGI